MSHRLTALLNAYVPPVLPWVDDIRPRLVCDVLLRWPTVDALKKVGPSTRDKCFHEHNAGRKATIAHRRAAIKAAIPVVTEQAVIHAAVLMLKA
jgi:hypothetical protein